MSAAGLFPDTPEAVNLGYHCDLGHSSNYKFSNFMGYYKAELGSFREALEAESGEYAHEILKTIAESCLQLSKQKDKEG